MRAMLGAMIGKQSTSLAKQCRTYLLYSLPVWTIIGAETQGDENGLLPCNMRVPNQIFQVLL